MDRISEMMGSYAVSVDDAAFSTDTLHEGKRRILDSLGCALAGYDTTPSRIAREVAATVQSTEAARILGTGMATTPEMAAFVNTVMIRYLDCNDSFVSVGGGHPSDMLSVVLGVGEVARRSGKAVLGALIVAYEIYGWFAQVSAIRERGWDHGIYIAAASACAAGRLLGLSREQVCHAISMSVVASVPLGQTRVGELSMWKGCATAAAVRHGVFSAMCARRGMEGPPSPFEGRFGLFEQVTGALELGELGASATGDLLKVCQTSIKYFPAQIHTQAGAAMALELRSKLDLNAVDSIRVETYDVAVRNAAGELEKWDPRNRETADHSLPYVVAVALVDGAVTPGSFTAEKVRDPTLRPLMNKIEVREDPLLSRRYPETQGARMEIRLASGRTVSAETSYPKGHFENPLTDRELESKFKGLAEGVLSAARQDELLDRVWDFDALPDLDPVFLAAQVA